MISRPRFCRPVIPGWTAEFRSRWVLVIGSLFLLFGPAARAREAGGGVVSFERDVRPILKAHCFPCHGEGEKLKAGVDLRLRRLMLTTVDSGTVLVPGRPAESLMLRLIRSGEMPKGEKKLTPAEVDRIERWIAQGAPTLRPEPMTVPKVYLTEEEREWWAFQPVRRPAVPPVRHPELVRNPVDAFLLARLETNQLTFAPAADRRTLIRRITFDLTGLPPSPEEVAAFLSDPSPEAYAKVVDRLLASSAYGEHWARHWLDVAGYADSNGGVESDSERGWAWRYRDYVIRSLNADLPWDRFITEQLAGDELVAPPFGELSGDALDKLIATGFLRLAPDPTGDGPADAVLAQNQVIADTLQIVSSAFLGLTVQCAQCHDHRYDPVPQSDYYRLRAVFEPAFDWKNWKNPGSRQVSLMAPNERALADCVEQAGKVIDDEAQRLHDALIEKFVQKQLEMVPEQRRAEVIGARRTPADKRTEEHKRLLREFPTFQDHIILGEVDVEGAKQVEAIRKRATEVRANKPADSLVHCLVEEPAGRAASTFVFHRGDPLQPREAVEPASLTVLAANPLCLSAPATNAPGRTSGRRMALARSLTSGVHPLTTRVLVNRFWHHHFGAGLVGTLGDFGTLGERPTHPELLDWLASEFVARDWSLKALHRLLVLSSAYQQSSTHSLAAARDPDNHWLGRMRLRRLEAESVRDGLLAVSGRLNPLPYGPPVPVAVNASGQFVVGAQNKDGNGDATGAAALGGAEFRRSIYVQVRRSMPVGVMDTFDAPALAPNCEARPVSTVPPQALMLLNDQFVLDRSFDLAERVRQEHPGSLRGQIQRAWQRVFGAEPTDAEMERSLIYLAEQTETLRQAAASAGPPKKDDKSPAPDTALQALASWCQAMLGSNRFLYVE